MIAARLALPLLVVLAGCAGPAPAPIGAKSKSDAGFALTGRIGVRYGEESLSGRIAWTHSPGRDHVSLASPLGNQLAIIERDASGVSLTDANGQRSSAPDAETLTERALGWRLPLGGLSEWARGRAAPGPAEGSRDTAGRWLTLIQAGWRIDYTWEEAQPNLPRRVFLERVLATPPLEIRMVVDRWGE
ncbi:MAG: lipoprotein insertase outer membrane protein LolB [Burkholderiales bacterium]